MRQPPVPPDTSPVTRATADRRCAEWLIRRVEPSELAEVIDWLRIVRPEAVVKAMQRYIIGGAIQGAFRSVGCVSRICRSSGHLNANRAAPFGTSAS